MILPGDFQFSGNERLDFGSVFHADSTPEIRG